MTPEEYSRRILKAVHDVQSILDSIAEDYVLPSQTDQHTRAERRRFKYEVVKILAVFYTPQDQGRDHAHNSTK